MNMSSDVMAIQSADAAGQSWTGLLHEWVTTVDHKRLGVLYILYALFFLVIGGVEATIIRIQLMHPPNDFVSPQDSFSFVLTAFGGFLLYFSFVGGSGLYGAGNAPDVGWWAYAPLASRAFSPGNSSDYWTVSLLVSGFGSIGTAINLFATILCMRCPGMKLSRMPLFV